MSPMSPNRCHLCPQTGVTYVAEQVSPMSLVHIQLDRRGGSNGNRRGEVDSRLVRPGGELLAFARLMRLW